MKKGIVEKITNGGWGLVRSDEGVVFLSYVLPGEEVGYRIKEKARGILWGELIQVLTPSPHRVEPQCPYYGQCGGCVFQHIGESHQQEIKKQILLDDLKRIAHFEPENLNYIPSQPYHYRIRARMKGHENNQIGFIRKSTNTVIPIHHCLLFPQKINNFLARWNSMEPPFFHQLDILHNPTDDQVYIHLSHPPKKETKFLQQFPEITFSWKGHEKNAVSQLEVGDYSYYISPTAFFQVNRHQWTNMLSVVESFLSPGQTIIDLYSGVGFFIPLLQRYAKRTVGVESHTFAVTLAQRAFPQAELLKIPAEKFKFFPADAILLDPPRSGVSQYVMANILEKGYQKVIYISCATAAFSRDLAHLVSNGYRLQSLNGLDLFPQTPHLESIALFVKEPEA